MTRFDDFSKQILGENLILRQTAKDFYKDLKDDTKIVDGVLTVTKTVDEKTATFEEYLKIHNIEKIGDDFLLNEFTLKFFSRMKYGRLKELVQKDLSILLINEYLLKAFYEAFENMFESAVIHGRKIEDLDLIDIKDMLEIAVIFISVFEFRLRELKKK